MRVSLTFNKVQKLVPWIGDQPFIVVLALFQHNHIYQGCWKNGKEQYFEMLVAPFYNNPDIHGYVAKLPKQHFNACVFSNPGDEILITVENV